MVDAAPSPIGPTVAQRPIPVNESVRQFTRLTVRGEQAVLFGEEVFVIVQNVAKLGGGFAFVVQMDLDFAETFSAQFIQAVEELGFVVFERVEERMARRSAVAVLKFVEFWVFDLPPLDSAAGDAHRRSTDLGLEMVGDAQKDMEIAEGDRGFAKPGFQERPKHARIQALAFQPPKPADPARQGSTENS